MVEMERPKRAVRVVREVIHEASVAVLVEVEVGGVVRQHWGGAQLAGGTTGHALARATTDAIFQMETTFKMMGPLIQDLTGSTTEVQFVGRSTSFTQLQSLQRPAPPRQEAAICKASTSRTGEDHAATSAGMTKLRHVLVVDDDPINVKVLRRALARAGIQIETGEDGQDVVQLCVTQGKRFDLILVDENMNHMNGSASIFALRQYEHENGLALTPAIATSGNSHVEDCIRYHTCGLNGLLVKPIDMRCVVETLNNYIEFRDKFGSAHEPPNSTPWDVSNPGYPDYVAALPADSMQDAGKLSGSIQIGELIVFGTCDHTHTKAISKLSVP